MTLISRFEKIYKMNLWKSPESRSGRGSEIKHTKTVRRELVKLIKHLEFTSILDAGCGDFNWMSKVPLKIPYRGCDIVPEMIAKNKKDFGDRKNVLFFVADIRKDDLPQVDVILCRCALYHLSHASIKEVLANFKRSGSHFALLTNLPQVEKNTDIEDGEYRRLNLQLEPFNLPLPLLSIIDDNGANEVLSLYRMEELPE